MHYVGIGKFYRVLFGWLPFSLGDILYTAAGIYLIIKVIKISTILIRKQYSKVWLRKGVKKALIICSFIYILFNINWGLNYNRLGIGYQIKIKPIEHTKEDLLQLTSQLITKVNEASRAFGEARVFPDYRKMFSSALVAYKNSEQQYPFLHYENTSVKRSLYGRVGNYLGFFGYYNPFTGESQLNLTQPRFLIPYVICHEMAHQVGYANESEANFVGYLTAISSPDPIFHYSVYFDLFNYANKELAVRDSIKARENYFKLDTLVRKDLVELRNYYKKYKSPLESVIKVFYDHYLKANQQDKGLESYNQVVGLLIAYNKKYGKI